MQYMNGIPVYTVYHSIIHMQIWQTHNVKHLQVRQNHINSNKWGPWGDGSMNIYIYIINININYTYAHEIVDDMRRSDTR